MNTRPIPRPEYPRPDFQRKNWMSLNGQWDFALFAEGQEAEEAGFAGVYDSEITVPFSWASPLSGVARNVAGTGHYRRTTSFAAQGRVFLCIGGADHDTTVYVNGEKVGSHTGAYEAFEFDVTGWWKSGLNTIEVRCEDYRADDQLYGKQGYGDIQGIWQSVWLEDRPEERVTDLTIVTKVTGEVAIAVETNAADGTVVTAAFEDACASAAVAGGKALLTLKYDAPRLWSPADPYLYYGKITLGKDEVETYFGIREIGTVKVDGRGYPWIALNGKPIYLNGTLDQAFDPNGHFTYPTEEQICLEVWQLKRLGLNMVRIHIKAEDPRKLYQLDKMGILVMEDVPCFWGEPTERARENWESAMRGMIRRDKNHPSTFCWVIFNETWGLFTKINGKKVYTPETQAWVRRMWETAKALDPTRLVEDNSACNYDHVVTDLNTWHFYINGYELVKNMVDEVSDNTYPGSSYNYIGENVQTNAPLMNSECGMVWGVDHSAGDSDIAWQYHYMMNEFRLHDKLCGFVFTEFHDVVNEFNGYYRIDGMDKDFGYDYFCRGMRVNDLHAADFVAVDCPPVRTVRGGETVTIPLFLSSYTDARHGEACTVAYEVWRDAPCGRVTDKKGAIRLPAFSWGVTKIPELKVTLPRENATEIVSLYLTDAAGKVVSRNFVTFDVVMPIPENAVECPVGSGKAEGFDAIWQALNGEKLCMGGEGSVSYRIPLKGIKQADGLTVLLEGSSKRVLSKDRSVVGKGEVDQGFMKGYLVDRGAFENSYWMTDETRLPSTVEVLIGDTVIDVLQFSNDPADARGVLSWNYQSEVRSLDEAGSYGEEKHIRVPSRLIPGILREGALILTFRVKGNGFALYGRKAGRYAHGLTVIAESRGRFF